MLFWNTKEKVTPDATSRDPTTTLLGLGPGELEALSDLARYRLLRHEDEAKLRGLEEDGGRSRFRRLEKRGLVSRHEAPGRIVYYALSQFGAEALGCSRWKEPPTAHRAVFEALAVASYCSSTGTHLLLPEDLECELLRREQEGQGTLLVSGLHKSRFLFEPDGRLSFLCCEVGAPNRNLFSFLASQRKRATTLAQKSDGWRALIERGEFSFTILAAHQKRPEQFLRVARKLMPKLQVRLTVAHSELLLLARGVTRTTP